MKTIEEKVEMILKYIALEQEICQLSFQANRAIKAKEYEAAVAYSQEAQEMEAEYESVCSILIGYNRVLNVQASVATEAEKSGEVGTKNNLGWPTVSPNPGQRVSDQL